MKTANPDAKGAPEPPPNLRVSKDEERECDTCSHYERGRCTMFPAVGHVDGEWVCDDWEQGRGYSEDREKQPKDLKGAAKVARQAFARRKDGDGDEEK